MVAGLLKKSSSVQNLQAERRPGNKIDMLSKCSIYTCQFEDNFSFGITNFSSVSGGWVNTFCWSWASGNPTSPSQSGVGLGSPLAALPDLLASKFTTKRAMQVDGHTIFGDSCFCQCQKWVMILYYYFMWKTFKIMMLTFWCFNQNI